MTRRRTADARELLLSVAAAAALAGSPGVAGATQALFAYWPASTTALPNWWDASYTRAPGQLPGGVSLFPRVPSGLQSLSYGWGANDQFQLGTGDTRPGGGTPNTVLLLRNVEVSALAASAGLVVGVTPNGTLWQWSTRASGAVPTQLPGLDSPVVAVAAGGAHALALTSSGAVYSWGDNSRGQLGRHTDPTDPAYSPATLPARVAFPTGATAVGVAAGRAHSLVLLAGGQVLGFGDNAARQLGLVACAPGGLPSTVDTRFGSGASNVSGCLFYGGLDPTPLVPLPRALAFVVEKPAGRAGSSIPWEVTPQEGGMSLGVRGAPMRAIWAAEDASFAAAAGDGDIPAGQLYAWGTALHGFGMRPASSSGSAVSGCVEAVPRPVATLAGVAVTSVAASQRHVVVTSSSQGVTYAWGDNTYGQLGTGGTSSERQASAAPPFWLPRRLASLDNVTLVSLAAGQHHSLAATAMGEVLAWGDNSAGQLGLGAPPPGFNASTSVALLTRQGWLIVPGLAPGNSTSAQPQGELANSSTSTTSSTDVTTVRRRSLLHATTDLFASVQPAQALFAAISGVDVGAAAAAAALVTTQAGAAPTYVPVPALVLGIQQVTAVLAAGASSYAVRAACFPGNTLDTGSGVCQTCAAGTVTSDLSVLSPCSSCDPGTYAADPGSTTCTLCAAGSFANASSSATCLPCQVGTFLPFPGGTSRLQCLSCQPGSYSTAPGAAVCTKCAAGTYVADEGSTQCLPCAPGTFQPLTGATTQQQCLKCPSGKFARSLASSTCTACAPGSHAASPGATSCAPCAPGSYSATAGAITCTPCPPGTSLPSPSGSDPANCTACAPGSVALTSGAANCTACAPGSYYDGVSGFATLCTLCPSGTYGNISGGTTLGHACAPCPLGTHALSPGTAYDPAADVNNLGPCTMCPPGTYADRTGETQCTPCPAGSSSSTEGALSVATCAPCPAGTFCPYTGMAAGLPCPEGTYRPDGSDVTACVPCPPGKYSQTLGATLLTQCLGCPIGTYTNVAGTSTCMACPAGTYSSKKGLALCTGCPPGTASNTTGASAVTTCTACPPGTYSGLNGSTTCTACPAGTYSDTSGAGLCTPCPMNTASTLVGSSSSASCLPCCDRTIPPPAQCSPGYYTPAPGAVTCSKCPAGSYAVVPVPTGSQICTACPAGTSLNVTGDVVSAGGAAPCSRCPAGFYAPTPGLATCLPCYPGSYGVPDGTTPDHCLLVPVGTYMADLNATSAAAAQPCPPGTYSDTPGAAACTSCPAGTYVSDRGATSCLPCPAGTSLSALGASDPALCLNCTAGSYSGPGAALCLLCTPGTYMPSPGAAACLSCPAGTANYLSGSVQASDCVQCREGTFAQSDGLSVCAACPAGSYSNVTGATACSLCPAGTAGNATGSLDDTNCNACAAGSFAGLPGASACVTCPAGTYCPTSATVAPTLCPPNMFGIVKGATAVKQCVWCPAFFVNATPGADTIFNCTFVPQSGGRAASPHLTSLLLFACAAVLATCHLRDDGVGGVQ